MLERKDEERVPRMERIVLHASKLRLNVFWEPGVRGDDVPVLRLQSRVGASAARHPDRDWVPTLRSLPRFPFHNPSCLSVTFISPSS